MEVEGLWGVAGRYAYFIANAGKCVIKQVEEGAGLVIPVSEPTGEGGFDGIQNWRK